jgi:hypothetical protein
VHLDHPRHDVYHPVLDDARPGEEGGLHLAIEVEGRVRDFDHQQLVGWRGMRGLVVIRPPRDQRHVRRGLRLVGQPDWLLHTHVRTRGQSAGERPVQPRDTRRVLGPNRALLDDVPSISSVRRPGGSTPVSAMR